MCCVIAAAGDLYDKPVHYRRKDKTPARRKKTYAVRSDGVEIKKLYPEQNAQARLKISGTSQILFYCNQHGLYKLQLHKIQGRKGK